MRLRIGLASLSAREHVRIDRDIGQPGHYLIRMREDGKPSHL